MFGKKREDKREKNERTTQSGIVAADWRSMAFEPASYSDTNYNNSHAIYLSLIHIYVKKQEEFQMTYQEEDMLYLLQGYGIQSSGGYSIRVEKVSENDTELHVKTKLIGPRGKMCIRDRNVCTYEKTCGYPASEV